MLQYRSIISFLFGKIWECDLYFARHLPAALIIFVGGEPPSPRGGFPIPELSIFLIRNAKLIAHIFFSKHKRLFFKYQVPLFVVFAVYVLSFLAEKVFAESVHKQKAIGK